MAIAPTRADHGSLPTDANLVTAIDMSGSIDRHAEWLEFDGMANALEHPAFLGAVINGQHGRIGFMAGSAPDLRPLPTDQT